MMNRYLVIAADLLGSQAALARACGYSRSGINLALHGRRKVSAELAVAIERATGGEVSRATLRPDLFRPMRPPRTPLLVAHSL